MQTKSSPSLLVSGIENTQDPNLNVGLPVFTIHGNHDDPSGPENLSAVDVLSTVHYVNYFGKHTFGKEEDSDIGRVCISPILIQKVCVCVCVCWFCLWCPSKHIASKTGPKCPSTAWVSCGSRIACRAGPEWRSPA